MWTKFVNWLASAKIAEVYDYAQQRMDERDRANSRAREVERALASSQEWLMLTALVRSQMTNKAFLDALGWDFNVRPIHQEPVPDELREQYVMEAKAMLMAYLLEQIFRGAKTKVATHVDPRTDGMSFLRFDVLLLEPFDCHVVFPVKIQRDEPK